MTCNDGITCHPPDGPHLRADQVVLCSGRLAIAGRRLAVGSSSTGRFAVNSSSGRFAVSSGGRFAVRSSGRCGAELVAVQRREAVGT